jgi:uncharacterized protein YxeA
MDKALKISIIVGILIVALSIAYYLVIFLPNKAKQQQENDKVKQEQKQECAKWALDKSKTDETNYDQSAYNDYLKRCLNEKGL